MSINSFNSNSCLQLNTHGYKFAYMKSTLAERLKEAMKIRGDMTQASLAEASGVAQPTIWRLVNGKAKGSVKLVDIANALAVNIDWLANGVGEMSSPNKESPYQIDKSLNIPVWNEKGKTEDFVLSPVGKPLSSYRAYIINRNTGCSDVSSGSIAITDYEISPGTQGLVPPSCSLLWHPCALAKQSPISKQMLQFQTDRPCQAVWVNHKEIIVSEASFGPSLRGLSDPFMAAARLASSLLVGGHLQSCERLSTRDPA